ncbi:MAG: hypothetical protein M3068_05185 [Gemmatimonadota bacterium]|nr:hypothetical protein [Gemmatimonadota bacterium]
MRSTGSRLSKGSGAASAELGPRVQPAVALLNELGGLVEVEERTEALEIRGYGCPLGEAVRGHPSVCRAIQSLVAEITGARVREQCDRSGEPSCRFLVARSA